MAELRKIEADSDGRKSIAVASSYRGPLPPPEMLKAYNECLPGSGEAILKEFTKQGGHRRFVEKAIVLGKLYFSPSLGLVVILVAFFIGFQLISEGKDIQGFVVLLSPLAGLAAVFVIGKISSNAKKD